MLERAYSNPIHTLKPGQPHGPCKKLEVQLVSIKKKVFSFVLGVLKWLRHN